MEVTAPSRPTRRPPRLPLPSLESTCNRYFEVASVHLSERERQKTAACIREFLSADGPALQQHLQSWDSAQASSFIHEFWLDAWLESRTPLPVAQNPGMMTLSPEGLEGERFSRRVAILISRALSFYRRVSDGALAPDGSRVLPWTMEQYPFLFSTSRLPGIKRDRLVRRRDAEHILIIRQGHFFALPVVDRASWIDLDGLSKAIEAILAWRTLDEPPVGLLTSLPRASWAIWRERLALSHRGNSRTLELIEGAILAFCIDPAVGSHDDAASWRALAGRPENRWYDRSFQLIYSEDGVLMGNLEHSAVDGVPAIRYADEICRTGEEGPGGSTALPGPELLEWHAPDDVLAAIEQARREHAERSSPIKTTVLELPAARREDLRLFGIGADFAAQFSFQAAYHKIFGRLPCGYETVGMRHFQYGRTDNLHPVTTPSAHAVALFDGSAQPETLVNALISANQQHQRHMNACARGAGIDRHLYGLWIIASHLNTPLPSLFSDPAFSRTMRQHDLSTAAIPASKVKFDSFGPAVSDGFGIGYVALDGALRLSVTSSSADHSEFCDALSSGFLKLQTIVGGSKDGAYEQLQ